MKKMLLLLTAIVVMQLGASEKELERNTNRRVKVTSGTKGDFRKIGTENRKILKKENKAFLKKTRKGPIKIKDISWKNNKSKNNQNK